jgi:hypothetical protein
MEVVDVPGQGFKRRKTGVKAPLGELLVVYGRPFDRNQAPRYERHSGTRCPYRKWWASQQARRAAKTK